MPVMSGKHAFLELLKQEGVEFVFGNPGTTELPLMDAFATENEIRYVLGLQEAAVMAMADGYAQASGKLTVCNFHTTPGLGNAMGMLYDAQKAGAPILVTAGQHEQTFNVTEPILMADLPPIARPLVKWSTEVHRLADLPRHRASRRQDRARAADRAGVPLAAGRHPARRRRHRPDGADAHCAAHPRRPRRGRGGGRDPGAGRAPGDHGRRHRGAEPRACGAGRARGAARRAGLSRVRAEHGVVSELASAVPRADDAHRAGGTRKLLEQHDVLFSVGADLFTLSLPSDDRSDAARHRAHSSRRRSLGDRQELSAQGGDPRRSQGHAAGAHRRRARAHVERRQGRGARPAQDRKRRRRRRARRRCTPRRARLRTRCRCSRWRCCRRSARRCRRTRS